MSRTPSGEERQDQTMDLETVYRAHAYITAGCCFALGLKYAGTCSQQPYQCLVSCMDVGILKLLTIPPSHPPLPPTLPSLPPLPTTHTVAEHSSGVCVRPQGEGAYGHTLCRTLSADHPCVLGNGKPCPLPPMWGGSCIPPPSVLQVMSGSGDLQVLRIIRKLHVRVRAEVTYGSHMATHMALGLLFLGGGR